MGAAIEPRRPKVDEKIETAKPLHGLGHDLSAALLFDEIKW
jgi:hypothetical protein